MRENMKLKSHHNFEYLLRTLNVDFKGESLNFVVLDNLDKTIDELCAALEKTGQGKDPLSEDYCPYFGVLWPSAKGLCQYVYQHKKDFIGKRVLEIGCGLALPSFILKKQGVDILATDFHRDVPIFLEKNFELNQIRFDYLPLNWREENEEIGKFDFVIGSDILYEGRHPYEVCRALIHYLKPNGQIILADPGRTYIQKFVTSMNELGFQETLLPESVELDGEKRDIFVFKFQFA